MRVLRWFHAFFKFPAQWPQEKIDTPQHVPSGAAVHLIRPTQSLQQHTHSKIGLPVYTGGENGAERPGRLRPPDRDVRARNRPRPRPLTVVLGIMILLSCVAWVVIVSMVARGMKRLFFPAVGIGITWACTAVCYGMDKYFHHKRSQHHESFLLEGAVTAAVYSYALAWSQNGPSLTSALLAVPPGVTFGMWTISKKINIQNRLAAS